MEITALRLAPCDDRQRTVQDSLPQDWLAPALPEGWTQTTFQYFVQWSAVPLTVSETCLVTLLADLKADESVASVMEDAIAREFNRSNASQNFALAQRLLQPYGKKVAALILPEHPAEKVHWETPIWSTEKPHPASGDIKRTTVRALAKSIRKNRGGPASIGNKGLILSTSAVECFLSTKEDSFPGDADCVIADEQDRIRLVIEYKKHNLRQPIGEHLANRYYKRRSDRRKYQALQALVDNLSRTDNPLPELHILYYAPRKPCQARLQQVLQVENKQLRIGRDTGDISTASLDAPELLKVIAEHLLPKQ